MTISERIDALFRALGDLSERAEAAGFALALPEDAEPVA